MSSPSRRREMDVMKLMMSGYDVNLARDAMTEFFVTFKGPAGNLVNVFEVFLPQLLLYPNPTDPLNGEAAALLLREPDRFKTRVRDYIQRFASDPNPSCEKAGGAADDDDASESTALSELSAASDIDEMEGV